MHSRLLPLITLAAFVLAACGNEGEPQPDAGLVLDAQVETADSGSDLPDASIGEPDAGLEHDAGPVDAGAPVPEQEPNNGATETELNAFDPPGAMTGAIDPAEDLDILGLDLRPGDVWTWKLAPLSQSLAPHLAIFEAADVVPDLVAIGAPGEVIEQEQLVLAGGVWYAAVRDERNVSGSASVGGADFTWLLEAKGESRAPTSLSFPSTVQGSLRHRFAIAVYSFHAGPGFAFDIDLRADRKSPRSDMDSRLSLYNATTKRWVHTNDDASNATTDSHIGADGLPAEGDYWLVVENVDPTAGDLSFELVTTLRQ